MKIAELIIVSLAFLGLIMNLASIPGGGALSVVGISALAIFYMILSTPLFNEELFAKDKPVGSKPSFLKLMGASVVGVVLAIIIVGCLFKIMMWPGSQPMLKMGLILLILLIVVETALYFKLKSDHYPKILKRMVAVGVIGVILYFLPPSALLEYKYKNFPGYIEAVKQFQADPSNKELKEKVEKERALMNKRK